MPKAVEKAATALKAARMMVDVRIDLAAANLRSLMIWAADWLWFPTPANWKMPLPPSSVGVKDWAAWARASSSQAAPSIAFVEAAKPGSTSMW